jgi:hypothetical protein
MAVRLPRSSNRTRLRKFILIAGSSVLLALVFSYALLLGTQAYSERQASAALTQLEDLKVGDPASSYDRAVSTFRSEAGVHVLAAGAFRFDRMWDLFWKLPQEWADELFYLASRAGLRWWRITSTASVSDGKLSRVSVGFMVVGRYEMLGTGWTLAPDHPSVWGRIPLTDVDRRTFLHWFHITSMPGGEGLEIDATPASTAKELHARHINRKCLLTFRGCDGLCELLPGMLAVLRERGTDWGGYTSVPPSSCKEL